MCDERVRHFEELALACVPLWSWRYDGNFERIECNHPGAGDVDSPLRALGERVRALEGAGLLPAVVATGGGLAWAVTARAGRYHALGPARLADRKGEEGAEPDFADALPTLGAQELARYASMLHKSLTGETAPVAMPGSAPLAAGDAVTALHLARLQDMIRSGDLRYKDLVSEVLSDRRALFSLGAVTIDSAKRFALLAVDLCRRAALEGGLTPKTVDALCAEYIPKIGAAADGQEIAQQSNILMYHLVRLVRRAKGASAFSGAVQACCTHIEEHACDKLTLIALAKHSGYSPDHLARKFKQEVGEPIKDYILRAKVNRAQLMLTTTAMPIGDIASTLSFCSASHFTKVFRRFAKKTPAAYRAENSHLP